MSLEHYYADMQTSYGINFAELACRQAHTYALIHTHTGCLCKQYYNSPSVLMLIVELPFPSGDDSPAQKVGGANSVPITLSPTHQHILGAPQV